MSIELPKAPNAETMKMLIRARNFIEHASMHASLNNEFDRMISIHNLDNSVAYILRIIIKHLEIEEISGRTIDTADLSQIIGAIEKFLTDNTNVHLSFIRELKVIRQLRNLVQHAMIDPVADLNTYLKVGYNFFERSLEKFFGITVEQIRYSSLITNTTLNDLLRNAESSIDNEKYLEATVHCRNAFEFARLIFNKNSHQRINRAPVFAELRNRFFSLYHYLKIIDEKNELDSYKVDINLYDRFINYINHIPAEYCADWHGNIVMQRPWERTDALFCYQFVADVIYRWQSMQLEPLYEIENIFPNTFVWIINGIELKEMLNEYGCIYGYGQECGKLFITDKGTKDQIENGLHEGQIYVEKNETYNSDKLLSKSSKLISIDFILIELATNDPALWEIIIWYKPVPFTYLNLKSSNSIDINTCDKSDLQTIGVFCKNFFLKVASKFSIVLQLHFPQCCKFYFPAISREIEELQTLIT